MNKTERIDNSRVLATCVRAFFEAFAMGVIDSAYSDAATEAKLKPKHVKQAMLDHYGSVGEAFFDQMFYTVAQLTYGSADEAVAEVRRRCDGKASIPDYMRVACRTDAFYEAMLGEYKRNFTALLGGQIPPVGEHVKARCRDVEAGGVEALLALRLVVRLTIRSYVKGLRADKEGSHKFSQVSLLRMLAANLNLLTRDAAIDGDFNTVDELLLHVCGSEEGFAAMSEEMNNTMNELFAN